MKKKSYILALAALLLLGSYGAAEYFSVTAAPVKRSFFAMNTYMEITAYGSKASAALPLAEQRIHELEDMLSVTKNTSEVYAINHEQGQERQLSRDTENVLRQALAAAEATDGAFEPTIYPLLRSWGFTTKNKKVPTPEELQRSMELVGYKKLQLEGSRLLLPAGMQLDFGGIGKGYAGDEALKTLRQQGVTSALVNLGGNVQALGSKPDGSSWQIALQAPGTDAFIGVLQMVDKAVITSGTYERYFIGQDGKKYGHILDPRTGYPVDNHLLSVTVVGRQGAQCDALATAFFVMGTEGAIEFWRHTPEIDIILVTDDGKIYLSESLAADFTPQQEFAAWPMQILRRNSK